GIKEDRAGRGPPGVHHHGDERRDHPPGTPGIGGRLEGLPPGTHSPGWCGSSRRGKKVPSLLQALKDLLEGEIAGNPMSRQRWVRRSLRFLTEQLQQQGYAVCPETVRGLLHDLGYELHANRKRFTGPAHPDRDRQFQYIAQQRQRFARAGSPVLSVDSKKKELIGNFKNAGRKWSRVADEVNAHDFRKDASFLAVPYGLYDPYRDRGCVYIGLSADTAEFATDAIAWWGRAKRQWAYPEAGGVLFVGGGRGRKRCSRGVGEEQCAAEAGRPRGAGGHRLPLPDGGIEMEPGRAPPVQPHQHQLGRGAAAESGDAVVLHPWLVHRGGLVCASDREQKRVSAWVDGIGS